MYAKYTIPDTFVEGSCFLDEKLAEAEIPVIEVPGFNFLGENSVINVQKTRCSLPDVPKG